ncbi:heme o synthase [Pirellulaceae bacterium]|nr:heme o synthase [Pirellulaceae bacterium]
MTTLVQAEKVNQTTMVKFRYFVELTKPRITVMVLITVGIAGYVAAPGQATVPQIINAIIGTLFIAASGAASNMYVERYTDFLMSRTAKRPLPAHKLTSNEVAIFGAITLGAGISFLFLQVSILAAILGLTTWVLYVLVYTPMKVKTWTNTIVGAIAGAMPILIGAAATTNFLNFQSWMFFGVLFFWQFPHFMAIAWMFRKDYEKSNLVMLTVTDKSGRQSGWLAVGTAIAMYFVCLPLVINIEGFSSQLVFIVISTSLCTMYLLPSLAYLKNRNDQTAKKLLRASIIFLPLFMITLACCQ